MVKRNPKEKVLAAGILLMTRHSPRSFLLMRHQPRKKLPDGRWDLPKGHCESGETLVETALRETEEETGIPPTEITIDPQFKFDLTYPVKYKKTGDQVFTKQVSFFLGYIDVPDELKLTEHDSAHWFAWDPPHKIQSQTIDPLLAALQEYLE